MKWLETHVIIKARNPAPAIDMISNILLEFGLQGVVVDDLQRESGEYWGESVPEASGDYSVTGYLPLNALTKQRLCILEDRLKWIQREFNFECEINCRERDEEDWAESWKDFFWPERITEHLVVKPTWREYHPEQNDQVIEIDPGMAFGTGTHPTTALCITLIEKYLNPLDTFLDIGCGSGILMITAAKLGADTVCGLDQDETAANIATENLRLNHIQKKKYVVSVGNLIDSVQGRFDIVAANILVDHIMTLLRDIRNVLSDQGIFICSGIILAQRKKVVNKMTSAGFDILDIVESGEWVAITGRIRRSKR